MSGDAPTTAAKPTDPPRRITLTHRIVAGILRLRHPFTCKGHYTAQEVAQGRGESLARPIVIRADDDFDALLDEAKDGYEKSLDRLKSVGDKLRTLITVVSALFAVGAILVSKGTVWSILVSVVFVVALMLLLAGIALGTEWSSAPAIEPRLQVMGVDARRKALIEDLVRSRQVNDSYADFQIDLRVALFRLVALVVILVVFVNAWGMWTNSSQQRAANEALVEQVKGIKSSLGEIRGAEGPPGPPGSCACPPTDQGASETGLEQPAMPAAAEGEGLDPDGARSTPAVGDPRGGLADHRK